MPELVAERIDDQPGATTTAVDAPGRTAVIADPLVEK